jgi:hypothetical protein
MINLSPEQIKQILADRKAVQAQRIAAELALANEKAKTETYWQEKKKLKAVTTHKQHQCAKCNVEIPVGAKAVVKSKLENVSTSGWTPQFLTKYFCVKCSPVVVSAVVDGHEQVLERLKNQRIQLL